MTNYGPTVRLALLLHHLIEHGSKNPALRRNKAGRA